MKKTVTEIARMVEGEVLGDGSAVITGISGIREAQRGEITFLANPKYAPLLDATGASCVITGREIEPNGRTTLIRTANPDLAFARLVSDVAPVPARTPGISKHAVIGNGCRVGKAVSVGPCAVIEDNAVIGDGTVVYPGVYIGAEAVIGSGVTLYPHVSIREKCRIGNNVIIHGGTVVGSDGFGFTSVEGRHHKIPQIGTVVIEDDCEIGANVTIDRARFGRTVIGKGTKVDNLVQIAHNVTIGPNSILVAQCGISGSTRIGEGVIIAGQAGIVGHIEIGDKTVVGAQAGVSKSLEKGLFVIGSPARPQGIWKRIQALVHRLPDLFKLVTGLEKRVKSIEERIDGASKDDKK